MSPTGQVNCHLTKRYEKVLERLGRLREKYARAAQYYEVSVEQDPTSGKAPLTVKFTDKSQGDVTSWTWIFGDGGSSIQQNPTHTYLQAGSYTVSLTVDGPNGPDTATATDYISVSERDNDTASVYLPALTR